MKKQYKVIVGVLIGIILLITIIKVFNIKQIILQKIYPKKYSEYVEKYAQEFGFERVKIFGDYVLNDFDEETSPRCINIFKIQGSKFKV